MAHHEDEEYRNLKLEVTTDKANIEEFQKLFEKALDKYFENITEGSVFLNVEAGRLGPPPPPPPPNGN